MSRTLTVYRLGRTDYDEAFAFQRRVVDAYARDRCDRGTLILLEHPPIITIGRSGTERNILASPAALREAGVSVRETNRGGDVTYHGPGQIVGYPILPLALHGKDVHAYLRRLESVLMAALADYGIPSLRKPGYTGVWTGAGKIVSIGVAISHWITYHGFALNVAPDLAHFGLIHPCGLIGVSVTSMERLLNRIPERAEVDERLVRHFCAEFGFEDTVLSRVLPAPEEQMA